MFTWVLGYNCTNGENKTWSTSEMVSITMYLHKDTYTRNHPRTLAQIIFFEKRIWDPVISDNRYPVLVAEGLYSKNIIGYHHKDDKKADCWYTSSNADGCFLKSSTINNFFSKADRELTWSAFWEDTGRTMPDPADEELQGSSQAQIWHYYDYPRAVLAWTIFPSC